MPPDDPNAHSASIEVAVPAGDAFAFMADGMQQSRWALGSWDRRRVADDLFVGTSLFDGTELYVRLVPHPDVLMVDYEVGADPSDLRRLVEARVTAGPLLGRPQDHSVITLTTWRTTDVSPEQWALVYHTWKTEVHLIKGLLERVATLR
jgi:hypothetical protein